MINRRLAQNLSPAPQIFTDTQKAPVLGWNARDSLADMKEGFAQILDNLVPVPGGVELRAGQSVHTSGASGTTESLMPWYGPAGAKLLSASGGNLYDVTTSGAVGAALATGKTSNRWQHVNLNGYLLAANGADAMIRYDGSSLAATGITGVSTAAIIHLNIYQERLFLIEKDKLKFWYLPVKTIAGAATDFDLSFVAKKGGALLAMLTWSRDGGNGLDDLAVFVTTNGEVIIYQGTDPSDASKWSLIGVFTLARPVASRRGLAQYGADALLLTEDGLLPVSTALTEARKRNDLSVSNLINPAFTAAIATDGSRFGWEVTLFGGKNLLLVNVPQSNGQFHQYVMNTTNRAWCRFRGIEASCLAEFNGGLYIGLSGGRVAKYGGVSDFGANIVGDAKTAMSSFRTAGRRKRWTFIRPALRANGPVNALIALDTDYTDREFSTVPSSTAGASSLWDTSPWDTTPWGAEATITDAWIDIATDWAYAAATRLRVASNSTPITWYETAYQMERGDAL